MARGRLLNKKVCLSLPFEALPDDTCRLMATWTIPHLDMRGVCHADPAVVRSKVFPRRDDISLETIAGYLDAMEVVGLIIRFRARGDIWQCWPGFAENQPALRADRERTDCPPPPKDLPARIPRESRENPAGGGKSAGPMESNPSESNPSESKEREQPTGDTPPVVTLSPSPPLPSSVPDPSQMTVKEVALLDLDKADWSALGEAESEGKNRAGVKDIVERKLSARHPAVETYREITRLYPLEALWPDIEEAVGDAPDDLELWGRIVKAWCAMGWKRTNVSGMLDFHMRREIPESSGARGARGAPISRLERSLAAVQEWRAEV